MLLRFFLQSIMELSSSSSWLVMLSWILALLLWTLLTWILDQSGASRNLLHSTTILLTIPQTFFHSTKHGSNLLTLTILSHLWHLLVIQSCTLLVSLVKVAVLVSFFDHSWNSNFSALATYLHLNLSNLWLLNFQLAIRKPSSLTSIALHLLKCPPFLMNSRIFSKFLFHHHLSSLSVVTSISMLILTYLLLTNFLASLIIFISHSTSTFQLTMMATPLICSSHDPALLLSHTFLTMNPTSPITNLSHSNFTHTSALQPNDQPSNTAPTTPLMLKISKVTSSLPLSTQTQPPMPPTLQINFPPPSNPFSTSMPQSDPKLLSKDPTHHGLIPKFSRPNENVVDLSDVGVAGSLPLTAWNSELNATLSDPSFPKPSPHFCPIL